jgi:DNA-binding NtrC family response regulator
MAKKIVLVDDEPLIVSSLTRVLKSAGLPVWGTTDPREALEYIKTNEPLAIISDQFMPEMTGLELLAAARLRVPHSARLLTTGSPSMFMLSEAINKSHVHFFLEKPVAISPLIELLYRVVDVSHRQRAVVAPPVERASDIDDDELYEAARLFGT